MRNILKLPPFAFLYRLAALPLALLLIASESIVFCKAEPFIGGDWEIEIRKDNGAQLTQTIRETWDRMKSSKLPLRMVNDIAELVTKYIPVGSSLGDAETILKNGGFYVVPYPKSTQTSPTQKTPCIIASMVLEKSFVSKTTVSITLFCDTGAPTQQMVGEVLAKIIRTTL